MAFTYINKKVKFKVANIKSNKNNCKLEIILNKNILNNFLNKVVSFCEEEINSEIEFSEKEIKILKYLSDGKNNENIARLLNVSVHTIKFHIHNIYAKLSVKDRTKAVVKAIKYNLINI